MTSYADSQVGLDLESAPLSVPGRSDGYALGLNGDPAPAPEYSVVYGYDTAGRLDSVTDLNASHSYTYTSNSNLRSTLTSPVHVATTTYEPYRDVIDIVENTVGTSTVSKFDYLVNSLGQRTKRANTGTAFGTTSTDDFTYNAKGEVVAATNTTLTARNQSFAYDDVGNRLTFTTTGGTTNYTANGLNQYTAIASSTPAYDPDGNQTSTGLGQAYIWDAENRLICVEPLIPGTGDKKVINTYDAQSRRVRRAVFTYTSGGWGLTADEKFIYDGWNVVAVLDATDIDLPVLRTHTWGLDLSGSLQGAGGVGGLLAVKDGANVYHYTYDANGNVSEVLDNTGTVVAHYEYDAFGDTFVASGTYASANEYRFSTKPLDAASGLYYYGFRYYNPSTGRWPSRDPYGEIIDAYPELLGDGPNLYVFIRNAPLDKFDLLGLMSMEDWGEGETSRGNCWRYAIGIPTTSDQDIHGLLPGNYVPPVSPGTDPLGEINCPMLMLSVRDSGGVEPTSNGCCPAGYHKITIQYTDDKWPGTEGSAPDVHFSRQTGGCSGGWSHKNGRGAAEPSRGSAPKPGFIKCGEMCVKS